MLTMQLVRILHFSSPESKKFTVKASLQHSCSAVRHHFPRSYLKIRTSHAFRIRIRSVFVRASRSAGRKGSSTALEISWGIIGSTVHMSINPEQAYVVQKIFQLYADGWGYKRICAELIRLGCKNAHGEAEWKLDRIGRILRNATYKGYIGYNKSHSDGYLTQKRINHRDEDFVYVKAILNRLCPRNYGIVVQSCV